MKNIALKILLVAFLYTVGASAEYVSADSAIKIKLSKQSQTYAPGDTLEFSWTPADVDIETVALIPVKRGSASGYTLHSPKGNGDPAITNGKFKYTFSENFVSSGSYYIELTPVGSDNVVRSKKKITVENKPSLYFGTKSGSVNSVSITSGNSVTLDWNAESVKNCTASSYPKNSQWLGAVKASGTKKIKVSTPTTFYLSCGNKMGEVTSSLKVETGAPEYSNATLVPSTSFVSYTYKLGTSQQKALANDTAITVFNSSQSEPIYFRIDTDKKPAWINTGYTKSQMTIEPNGTMGIGAFADPSMVTSTGTYKWTLTLEGNFSNSPLEIPITMKITK